MMKEKAVLLLGSYGQTNIGDDLLMYNYLSFLRGRGFGKIYVNATDARDVPELIRTSFPELEILPTYKTSLLGWVRVLRSVSCVVYGGGTVFKELYASTGRGKYSVILRIMLFNFLARLLGAQIYYLHIGIGVIKTRIGRAITRGALASAKLSIFRDDQSFLYAHDILALQSDKLCLATDGFFLNDVWLKPWHETGVKLPKNKKVVGINVLSDIPDWVDRQEYIRTIKTFVHDLLDDGYHVVLMPFQHSVNTNNDYVFMQREMRDILKHHKNIQILSSLPLDQVVSLFKRLDFFVGMRFHSLFLALSAGTPFVALAYDTKCWRFIKEIEYEHALRLEDASIDRLKSVFKRMTTHADSIRPALKMVADEQIKLGQKCIGQLDF